MYEGRGYVEYLYLSLNFVVNLKLILKKQTVFYKKVILATLISKTK